MLRTTIAIALLLTVTSSRADNDPSAHTAPARVARLDVEYRRVDTMQPAFDGRFQLAQSLRDDHRRAIAIRNSGIALSVLGTLSSIAGAVMVGTNACIDGCNYGSNRGNEERLADAGIGLLAVGQLSVIAGIPLWAGGQTRATRAAHALLSLSASGARVTF